MKGDPWRKFFLQYEVPRKFSSLCETRLATLCNNRVLRGGINEDSQNSESLVVVLISCFIAQNMILVTLRIDPMSIDYSSLGGP